MAKKQQKTNIEEAVLENPADLEEISFSEEDLDNSGLRDLLEKGKEKGFLTYEEINLMLDGLQQSYQEIGRDNHTQYFLKTQSTKIAKFLSVLGQRELLKDLKELDPDRRDLYHKTLESISQ